MQHPDFRFIIDTIDFPNLSLEQTNIVLVDSSTVLEAENQLSACENCMENAELSFDYILDALTGCDPTVTEYLLRLPAKCPNCHHEVTEKTLVIPA